MSKKSKLLKTKFFSSKICEKQPRKSTKPRFLMSFLKKPAFLKNTLYLVRNLQEKTLHYLLSPKEQSKENLIKIYRLNKKLIETDEENYQKNAELLTKILEILICNPELYVEVCENLQKFVSKFLFCENERILGQFREICNKNIKKPTYIRLIEETLRNFQQFQKENLKKIAEKDRNIEEFRKSNEEIRKKLVVFEETQQNEREISQRFLEEKTQCLQKTINAHLTEKSALKSCNELQKAEIAGLRQEIQSLTTNYEEKIRIIRKENEKKLQTIEKDFATFKQKYHNFSENIAQIQLNYRTAIQLLKKLRKKLSVTEEKLAKSESENYKLSLRAATNFNELTPRPNYQPLLELLNESPLNFTEKSSIEKTNIFAEKFKIVLNNCKNSKKTQEFSRSSSTKKRTIKDRENYKKIAFSEVRLGDYEEKYEKKAENELFRKSSFKQKIMKQQTLEPYD